jgi:predicted secreted protein
VSTILDALKRLEKETPTRDIDPLPAAFNKSAVAVERSRKQRQLILTVCLSAIIMGGIIFGIYHWKGTKTVNLPNSSMVVPGKGSSRASIPEDRHKETLPAVQQPLNQAQRVPSASSSVAVATRPAETKPKGILPGTPAKQPIPDMRPSTDKPSSVATPLSPESKAPGERLKATSFPPAAETTAKGIAKRPSPPSTISTKDNQSKRSSAAPKTLAAKPAAVKDPYAQAEKLTSKTLQVQAISWSERPAKRLAVIDGRILREGGGVSGYRLVEIRPEAVILEKAGKYWKVAFGSR